MPEFYLLTRKTVSRKVNDVLVRNYVSSTVS